MKEYRAIFYLMTVLTVLAKHNVHAYTLHNVTALRRYLFETKEYDKISRPMINQSAPTEVRIVFNVYTIYDIVEVTQTLKVSGSLQMQWLDEALMWNPADFEGIQFGVYPQDDVWKPGIALKNSVESFQTIGDPTLHVVVAQNGTVSWDPYEIFSSRCVFDITYFPFDKQICEITFVTWGYRSSDIILSGPSTGKAINVDDLLTHPVWHLDDVTFMTSDKPRPMIIYYLSLRRKPRYIISSVILPLIVLIILNVCVFILPGGSGEKVSFAITVFLSFVVFSTLLDEALPVNSENVCYLSVFITAQVFQSAIITILAILLIRMERRSDPVPIWLAQLVCWYTWKNRRLSRHKTSYDYCVKTGKIGDIVQKKTLNLVDVQSTPTIEKERENPICDKDLDWEQTVHRLDFILFGLFLSINALITIICFASISAL